VRRRPGLLRSLAAGLVPVVVALSLPVGYATFTATTGSTANTFTAAAPPPPPQTTWYLHADPTPPSGPTDARDPLPMDATPPTATVLHNYDQDRDDGPGLLLVKGPGLNDTNPNRTQRWAGPVTTAPSVVQGAADVILWSATADFSDRRRGAIVVGLYDCDAGLASCTLLSNGGANARPWPAEWSPITVDLGTVDHTLAAGRRLMVKLAVQGSAERDLRFAYDTVDHPARLRIG
jgi:hypothetical protein